MISACLHITVNSVFRVFFSQVSRDLVCFLQLDHVNVYYGQDYRNKYKAPTDYCLVLKVNIYLFLGILIDVRHRGGYWTS